MDGRVWVSVEVAHWCLLIDCNGYEIKLLKKNHNIYNYASRSVFIMFCVYDMYMLGFTFTV